LQRHGFDSDDGKNKQASPQFLSARLLG